MERGKIRRTVLVLIITVTTVAYVQFSTLERWSEFWHASQQRSPESKDLKVIYVKAKDINGGLVVPDNDEDTLLSDKNIDFESLEIPDNSTNITDFSEKPLMVLFTSWEYSEEKEPVHEMLRKAWMFWPSVFSAVVMTKDRLVQQQAKAAGWRYQTVTEVNKDCQGPPVLPTMFRDVMKKHDAFFYGYSNADIIFGDGLEKTMKHLYYNLPIWKTQPVLVVGRRYNVKFKKEWRSTVTEPENISAITKNGTLVIRSTDYFFSNRHFPWGSAPKVSIGKVWVVRAIIGWALKKGYFVLDATRTIQAVHLTTDDGVFASWHKKGAMCNERVLSHWSVPLYIGHCECTKLETFFNRKGDIRIRSRAPNKLICTRNSPVKHGYNEKQKSQVN